MLCLPGLSAVRADRRNVAARVSALRRTAGCGFVRSACTRFSRRTTPRPPDAHCLETLALETLVPETLTRSDRVTPAYGLPERPLPVRALQVCDLLLLSPRVLCQTTAVLPVSQHLPVTVCSVKFPAVKFPAVSSRVPSAPRRTAFLLSLLLVAAACSPASSSQDPLESGRARVVAEQIASDVNRVAVPVLSALSGDQGQSPVLKDIDDSEGTAFGSSEFLDEMWVSCEAGDMEMCDDLYYHAPFGSDYEAFALSCGGTRSEEEGEDLRVFWCTPDNQGNSVPRSFEDLSCDDWDPDDMDSLLGPWCREPLSYGDDLFLDRLWDACADGDLSSCDSLSRAAIPSSSYEAFARSCGGIRESAVDQACVSREDYGDDPDLDLLWDACAGGDMVACDDLYYASGFGTGYEEFALSCGGTRTVSATSTWCGPQQPSVSPEDDTVDDTSGLEAGESELDVFRRLGQELSELAAALRGQVFDGVAVRLHPVAAPLWTEVSDGSAVFCVQPNAVYDPDVFVGVVEGVCAPDESDVSLVAAVFSWGPDATADQVAVVTARAVLAEAQAVWDLASDAGEVLPLEVLLETVVANTEADRGATVDLQVFADRDLLEVRVVGGGVACVTVDLPERSSVSPGACPSVGAPSLSDQSE
jgi:hypothetical protein